MNERELQTELPTGFIVVAVLALIFTSVWSVVLVLAPLPVYLATKRRGPVQGGIIAIAMSLIAAALMSWAALPVVLILFGLGYIPGLMGPAEHPGRRVVAMAVFLIVILCGLAGLAYLFDRAEVVNMINEQSKIFKDWVLSQSGSKADAPALRAEISRVTAVMPYILMAATALGGICLAWLNYFITGIMAQRWNLEWTALPRFSRWQMHWSFVYGFIVGLVGTLFSGRFGAYQQVVYGTGLGFLLVFGFLYFIQGMAVINFFADKHNFSPIAKVFLYIFGLLTQLVFQGLSWLGLFDTWFDFRKLASSG